MLRLLHIKIHHLCEPKHQWNPNYLRILYSSSIPRSQQNPSNPLTVSFLTDSCGLSPSLALSVSKDFFLKSLTNPNAILALLKDHGFTSTHIAKLIAKRPTLLHSNPEKTIKPKLEFYRSIGYSCSDLEKLLNSNPNLLLISLERKLRHNLAHLVSVLGSGEAATIAINRCPRLLNYNFEKVVLPNVRTLQDHRVPLSNVVKLATQFPRILTLSPDRFEKNLEALKKLGIKPDSSVLVYGMHALCGTKTSTWERKMAMYRSLGWSEEETMSAFVKEPKCMVASEEKIRKAMDFYVSNLHVEPSFLSARPKLLLLGFAKRIVPRCAVINLLSCKGLVGKKRGICTFLMMGEKAFFEEYVMKHRDQVPEVIEAYQGKVELEGLEGRIF